MHDTDPYSRLVYILKVALPLIALAILSTLFLTSNRVSPGTEIPFAAAEVAERIRDERITGPFFSGVTSQGHRVTLAAGQVGSHAAGENTAKEIAVRVSFLGESELAMVADQGNIDILNDVARLSGNILIDSSTGYKIYTDIIEARMLDLDIVAPSGIQAVGPMGRITAEHLRVGHVKDKEDIEILFSGGVRLLHTPKEASN